MPAKGGGFQGQGGVGTGMSGVRIVGPNGRDQTYTPGGDPTFRKGAGVKGGGKGGVVPGAGVGGLGPRVRFEEESGTGNGLREEGGESREPLPVEEVRSERDQALMAIQVL